MAKTTSFKAENYDEAGALVVVEGTIKTYEKPTVKVTVNPDPATTPVHSGDLVTFTVVGTTDPDASPSTLALFIDGQEKPLDANGQYVWVAP